LQASATLQKNLSRVVIVMLPDLHPYLGPVTHSEKFVGLHKKFRLDGLGCRWNPQIRYDANELPVGPVRILVGGSVVFGVGATADDKTIAAQMTVSDGIATYPIGERSLGSWQEIHGFLTRLPELRPSSLVILSGYNDGFWASRYLNVPDRLVSVRRLLGVVNTPFLAQSHLGFASMGTSRVRRILAILVAGVLKLDLLREAMLVRRPIRRWLATIGEMRQLVVDHDHVVSEVTRSQMVTTATWAALARSLNCEMKFFLQPSQTWMAAINSSSSSSFKGSDIQRDFFVRIHKALVETLELSSNINGFQFHDLNKDFLELDNWREMFVDDVHLNDDGQKFLAQLITTCKCDVRDHGIDLHENG